MSVIESEARELTAEEQEARGQECYDINQQIKAAILRGRTAYWDLAAACYEFNERDGWRALGHDTQGEWLAQPDIQIPKHTFMRLIRLHKQLVIFRHLPVVRDELPEGEQDDPAAIVLSELDPSKLTMVMPTIESGKKPLPEILTDVREMGARDLAEVYVKAPEAPPPDPENFEPGENGDARTEAELKAAKDAATMAQAATAIDSWLELGGDRRKAQRHLAKLIEVHPFFAAWAAVQGVIEGGEGAPERTEVTAAWKRVTKTLKLSFVE